MPVARRSSARGFGRVGHALGCLVLCAGCARSPAPAHDESELRPGGETTTPDFPFPSSELPASNLPRSARPSFFAGRALAHQPWVKAPAATDARDGLGPLYNARTCLDCHKKGGRGSIQEDAERPLASSFLRLSIPGDDARLGAVPEPSYGLQLQTRSTALSHELRDRVAAPIAASVPPEARVRVRWKAEPFVYPDGQRAALRRPVVELDELAYGALHRDARHSLRVAPPIHGMGLVERIDQRDIDALADPNDTNRDGISGRVNRVWDFRNASNAKGRFGYKASRATLEITVALAFAEDIGITTSLFPEQACTSVQTNCREQTHGAPPAGVELSDELLTLVVGFTRNLGVPARRAPRDGTALAGRRHFYEVGCTSCHHPRFATSPSNEQPHLGNQVIWPYGDFLLHDMGPELADDRADYEASGREWRTTPLWGVGLSASIAGVESYLHDGRARNLEEAILWHGGEAEPAKRRFVALPRGERNELLAFLSTL